MDNISLNCEPLRLRTDINYIVIDALYLNTISENKERIESNSFLLNNRSIVFPYMDSPFAIYLPHQPLFNIKKIKRIHDEDVDPSDTSLFATDTGLLVFVDESYYWGFPKFVITTS